MSQVLYIYQQEMRERIETAFASCGAVMCQMPTGTGKTHLLAAVVKDFLASGSSGDVWIIAHRRELVAQIEETLEKHGLGNERLCKQRISDGKNGGCESSSLKTNLSNGHRIRVMSIQWFSRHYVDIRRAPDLIVIDEAHHSSARSYRLLWTRFPAAKKLGMTATPCRLNGTGFTEIFDCLISSWSIAEFIKRGRLAPFDFVTIAPESPDQRLIDSLEKRGADGDFQSKEMNAALNKRATISRLFESVERYARGRKGIVYAIGIAHARNIAQYFENQGLRAVAIDSRTPADERKRLVEAFRRGDIRVLVNVDVFSEGFDCPDVEFIQLARPTLSLAKYLQQVGRGLRRSRGKTACVIIDNVGLHRAFGLPTNNWDWAAMFEGRMAGKGRAAKRNRVQTKVRSETCATDGGEMKTVMTHERLAAMLREENVAQTIGNEQFTLKAFEDKSTGLWGLSRGGVVVAAAQFSKVAGITGRFAAVRLANMRFGVVDTGSSEVLCLDVCKEIRPLPGEILQVTPQRGEAFFIDLRNKQKYRSRPEIIDFDGIEMLLVGDRFVSRTRRPFIARAGTTRNSFIRRAFYIEINEFGIPAACRQLRDTFTAHSKRCVLDGDTDDVYFLSGALPDGSIIVMDSDGRYFRATKGCKEFIARNDPRTPDESFDNALARLMRDIGQPSAEQEKVAKPRSGKPKPHEKTPLCEKASQRGKADRRNAAQTNLRVRSTPSN